MPPLRIIWASPCCKSLKAIPIACVDDAQAVVITALGPFAPILIAISPAEILEIIIGTKNGLTLPGPFSNNILCCFSKVPIPPIPEPIITPVK